eukprot:g2547.t1
MRRDPRRRRLLVNGKNCDEDVKGVMHRKTLNDILRSGADEGKSLDPLSVAFTLGSCAFQRAKRESEAEKELVVVGTYTQKDLGFVSGKGKGIAVFEIQDPETGTLKHLRTFSYPSMRNPSYIISNRSKDSLFICDEKYDEGSLSLFNIEDRKSGTFVHVNTVSTKGSATCHAALDSTESYVFAASYGGPGFSIFPILPERIGDAIFHGNHDDMKRVRDHDIEYPGINRDRQDKAHPHMCTLDRNDRLHVVDLGQNTVCRYTLNLSPSSKAPCTLDGGLTTLRPGAGPRHMRFHKTNARAYVVNELDSTVSTCVVEKDGSLSLLETISALPPGFRGAGNDAISSCAAIRIHPSGRWLYVSNRVVRGSGIITHFAIHPRTGVLSMLSSTLSGGSTPRDFNFAAKGRLLLVANQESDNIVSFSVDPATGRLSFTGSIVDALAPVCLCVV